MSRARKILRFTFWTNNLTLLLIVIPMLATLYPLPHLVLPATIVLILLSAGFQSWYLIRKLKVSSFQGLYWVDDERDREITFKVHSKLLTSGVAYLYGLLLITFVISQWHLTGLQLGAILFVLIWLGLIGSNLEYYWLWTKFDQA